jgi:hypothetical protein
VLPEIPVETAWQLSSDRGRSGDLQNPCKKRVRSVQTLVRAAEFDRRATMVRYFCDWCGQETGGDEIRIARILIPPNPPITTEICSECARNAAAFALQGEQLALPVFKQRRLSRRKSSPELARGDGEEGR